MADHHDRYHAELQRLKREATVRYLNHRWGILAKLLSFNELTRDNFIDGVNRWDSSHRESEQVKDGLMFLAMSIEREYQRMCPDKALTFEVEIVTENSHG